MLMFISDVNYMKTKKSIIPAFCIYLEDALGISITVTEWQEQGTIPFFLRDTYAFYTTLLLKTHCLIMIPRENSELTPLSVKKHMSLLHEKWQGEIIYLNEWMTAYNRKRLIEQKVPFVVPDKQMYLPFLGIDLREHFRKLKETPTRFSPSTQNVVIYDLIFGKERTYTPSGLASVLGYTTMTLTRAFDELEAASLAEVKMKGKERILSFRQDKKLLWDTAKNYLSSPVKKRIWIAQPKKKWALLKAGLSALAHYSMLSEPTHRTFAVGREKWDLLRGQQEYHEYPFAEPGAIELEIWNYDPDRYAKDGFVDHFSLYLSLQGTNDERTESALEEMMEKRTW